MKKKRVFAPEGNVRARKRRIFFVLLFFVFSFSVLAYRCFHLQLAHDDKLARIAKSQYRTKIPEAPPRGNIYDADGQELAVSVPSYDLAARPWKLKETKAMVQTLSEALSISTRKLEKLLSSEKKYVWVKRYLSPQEKASLQAIAPKLRAEGMELVKGSKRFYPNREVASQILGAVGRDHEGLSGLEYRYNRYLRGVVEDSPAYRDARGKMFETEETLGKEVRDDVHHLKLTIRKNIQYTTEKEIEETCKSSKAKSCTAIVLDPATGAVLAMASYPSFNPNAFQSYDIARWRNIAVTDGFEPGSTFKTILAASALEKKVVRAQDKFDCERGDFAIGRNVIHDHEKYAWLSVRDIIKVSSNIGIYKIAQKLGRKRFGEMIHKFGFGSKTGIDYPGEVPGSVRDAKNWREIEFANIAFGQGILVTPIQLASAYATIANDGVRMKPYLVSEIQDAHGKVLQKNDPVVVERVLSPETAHLIRDIMTGVTQEGGTATKAALPGYSVAGKTGTAQKVIDGRYSHEKFVASFVGMVPAEHPRFVVLVTVDEPKGIHYGGLVAAPVFRNIAWAALTDMGVPRDARTETVVAKKNEKVENRSEKKREKKQVQAGLFLASVPKEGAEENQRVVPDLHGLSKRQVMAILDRHHLDCQLRGSGVASAQRPPAGTPIESGRQCQVIFRTD